MKTFLRFILMLYLIQLQINIIFSQTDSSDEVIKVKIFSNYQLNQVTIIPETWGYSILNDKEQIAKLAQRVIVRLSVEDTLIRLVINNNKDYGLHKRIFLKEDEEGGVFKIISGKDERFYYNNIEITNISGNLVLINHVKLDYYIAGVIEAEGGFNANMEFYKTQAIIARTYTLSHLRRHEMEGYHLCDNVHCQVYNGKCRTANMLFAAMTTKDIVIIDENSEYIAAAFHANCGGQTVNSEDVWSKYIPYLRSVKDTFCLNQFRATWEEKILVSDWENYLKKMGCHIKDNNSFDFYQKDRKVFYEGTKCKIPLKQIRSDFNLRSTYFTMLRQGDYMVVKGRGSGHGVGLCQAGAKRMAELGFSAEEIINYYYTNVRIVNRKKVKVFYPKTIKDN